MIRKTSISNGSLLFLILKTSRIGLSFVIIILSAKIFGLARDLDNWLSISTLMLSIGMITWGGINEILRTKLSNMEGTVDSSNLIQGMTFWTIILSIVLGSIIHILKDTILTVYLETSVDSLINIMIYGFIPVLTLTQLNQIFSSVLNVKGIYVLPELLGLVSSIIGVILLIIIQDKIGVLILLVIQIIVQFINLLFLSRLVSQRYPGIFWSTWKTSWNLVKPIFFTSIPMLLPILIGQINLILEKKIALKIGVGIVSSINYASQYKSLIQVILSSLLLSMMVPKVSTSFVKNNNELTLKTTKEYSLITFLILIYGISVMICNNHFIVPLIYDSKEISENGIDLITRLNLAYTITIFPVLIYILCGMMLLGIGKIKQYAILGSISQVLAIIIILIFHRNLKENIFPISIFTSHALISIGLLLHIPKFIRNHIFKQILKASFAILLSILINFSFVNYLTSVKYWYLNIIITTLITSAVVISLYLDDLKSYLYLNEKKN